MYAVPAETTYDPQSVQAIAKKVSPNTRAAGAGTMHDSPCIFKPDRKYGTPIIRRDIFDALPVFYRAVAEVCIEHGRLVLRD